MPRPVTPFVGCDVFITNEQQQVLLIRRADNGYWALPGGCHDLGETPKECAERECFEETGLRVRVTRLLGVFSSNRYEYVNYPWKENEFCHLLFQAEQVGGELTASDETVEIAWFDEEGLPPLSDGHEPRIRQGFQSLSGPVFAPYFE